MKSFSLFPRAHPGAACALLRRVAPGLVWAGLLALSGCMVGPDYQPPADKMPDNWTSTVNSSETAVTSHLAPSPVTAVDWWREFNDPILNDLVRQAAAQNLTVLQAEARIRQSRASLGVTRAGLFPTVNGTGSYNYGSSAHIVNDEPVESPPHTSFQSGLDAVWELDIFGGTRRGIEAAQAGIQASIEDRRDTLVTLVAEIGVDYIDLRSNQNLLKIAQDNYAAQQNTSQITQRRQAAGFVARLDVENSDAAAASTRASIPSLETAIRTDIYDLSVLLGREPGDLVKDLDPAGPVPVAPDNIPIGLPADLIRRRADIRAAEEQLHADTANIGVAVAQWFPQFSVNGSFGFQGVAIGQMTQWAAQTWSWGPTVNWPIFAGGRIDAQIELQKAVLEGDIDAYKSTVLTAMQEVETAIIAFNKEQERRAALHEVVGHYQQAYDLSQSLYNNGSTEFINVLTAELSLFSSQNQLANSEANVSTDLIALYKALGGGWSEFPEHDADVVPDDYKPMPTIPPRSLNPVHQ